LRFFDVSAKLCQVSRKSIRRAALWAQAVSAELRWSWRAQSLRGFALDHAQIGAQLLWFALRRACGAAPYSGWRARLRACGRCPVFHKALRTCGKPGALWFNPATGDMEQRGCLCPLRVKAQVADATCWAEEDYWKDL
jgi:hypothetical protein